MTARHKVTGHLLKDDFLPEVPHGVVLRVQAQELAEELLVLPVHLARRALVFDGTHYLQMQIPPVVLMPSTQQQQTPASASSPAVPAAHYGR